jgi:hypothetical protein
MALQLNYTTQHDFEAGEAYFKVNNITITNKDSISFDVLLFKNKDSLDFFENKLFTCAYDIDGDNPIKQAYLYLKTLPEFADATDV